MISVGVSLSVFARSSLIEGASPASLLRPEIMKTVLVQREMECGCSPSIARASVGRGAADRNVDWHEEAGAETATDFKRRSARVTIVTPGSPHTDIVALRPGGGLGFTAEAHARSEGQRLGKKNLESRVRGAFQLSTG